MSKPTTPDKQLVVFLLDVPDPSPSLRQRLVSIVNRLLAVHNRCPQSDNRWIYQLFHSSHPYVGSQPRHKDLLPVSSESFNRFTHELGQRAKLSLSTTSPSVSSCTGVVKEIDNLLVNIGNLNSTGHSTAGPSENDEVAPDPPLTLSTTEGSPTTTVYLMSSAVQVARDVAPSASHILEGKVSENVNPAAKPVSCDPYLDLSCSATSLEPKTELPNTAELTRVLKALANRRIQLNWVDTDMARIADSRFCKILGEFSDLLTSVCRSYRSVHLNSLFLDERIIPIESLFSRFDPDSPRRDQSSSKSGRGVAPSVAKWVDVDVGTLATGPKKDDKSGGHSFQRLFTARFTSEDPDVLTPLFKDDSSHRRGLPPRPRMFLRCYIPEINDEELDKLHAFDGRAIILSPADREKSSNVAERSEQEPLFAGLMARLGFIRAHILGDIFTPGEEGRSNLHTLLIRPISASVACARVVKVAFTSSPGATNFEHCRKVLPGAIDGSLAVDDPQTLLISKDSIGRISNRFLPSLWMMDRDHKNTAVDSDDNPLMAELKKQSTCTSSKDTLHLTRSLNSPGSSDGNPRFDAICGLLSKNRDYLESKNISPVGIRRDAEMPGPILRLRLRLPGVPRITRKINKEAEKVSQEREESIDAKEIDTSSLVHAVRTIHKKLCIQEYDSSTESQDSGSLRSIPQMTSKHDDVSLLTREKSNGDLHSEPSAAYGRTVPKKTALFPIPDSKEDDTLQRDSEIVATNSSRGILKSPYNSVVSESSNSEPDIEANTYSDYSKGVLPTRPVDCDSGMKRNGAELLHEASVHCNHCKSRLLNAQGHNVREEVRACLDCISAIVEIIANAEHWETVRSSVANYVQKKSQILASLRNATKEMRDTREEAPDLPSPSFWNTILHAFEQVVWQIAEGANRQQQGIPNSGRKKVPRHTRRAISLLNSIQLIAPSIPTQVGQCFFGEILAEFLQVVLMKFLRGTQHDSFTNALSLIFIDYDIDYSSACFAVEKGNNATIGSARPANGTTSSESEGDSPRRSEANSDDASLHSQRKRGFSETARDPGAYRGKKPRKSSHRGLSEMIADSRNKNAAMDRNGSHRSRSGLDLGRARSLQKPLSVARDKRRKSVNN